MYKTGKDWKTHCGRFVCPRWHIGEGSGRLKDRFFGRGGRGRLYKGAREGGKGDPIRCQRCKSSSQEGPPWEGYVLRD